MDKKGSLVYVSLVCFVATLGGFLFGYDLVVIGGAKPFYEALFGITGNPVLQGWVISCAYVGCLFGAIIAGSLTDRLGRKPLLIFSGLLFGGSAIGMALAASVTMLVLFRIICGLGIGIASTLSPMYIAEITPREYRGRFVAFNQLAIVIGILAAQVVNYFIAQKIPVGSTPEYIAASWNAIYGWRWMLAAITVPSACFFTFMFFVPESPRWLAGKGKTESAKRVLTAVGGTEFAENEIDDIAQTLQNDTETTSRLRDLLEPRLRPIITLGIFIAVYSQWCGINVIFNYADEIFRAAGYELDGMMFNIVVTGLVNLVFTFVAIATVDSWGRRPLFCLGSGGLGLIFIILGTCYHYQMTGLLMLLLVVAAIGCFAMTIGPMSWVIIAELFPNRVRGAAMSVAVFALWMGCTTLTLTFPWLNHTCGASGTFWLYGAISLAAFGVLVRYLPETKGKSLEQIERELT